MSQGRSDGGFIHPIARVEGLASVLVLGIIEMITVVAFDTLVDKYLAGMKLDSRRVWPMVVNTIPNLNTA
jgi:hypothetical protein